MLLSRLVNWVRGSNPIHGEGKPAPAPHAPVDTDAFMRVGGNAQKVTEALVRGMRCVDQAYNSGKVPPNHTADIQFMAAPTPNVASVIVKGKERFVATGAAFLEAQPGFHHVSKVRNVQILTPGAALSDVDITISGLRFPTPDGGQAPIPEQTVQAMVVWRKEGCDWLFAAVRFLTPLSFDE